MIKYLVHQDTPVGSNVAVALNGGSSVPDGGTVTYSAVTAAGSTTFTAGTNGPVPPAGFAFIGTPPTYYEIATTATVTPPIQVCLNYSDDVGIRFDLRAEVYRNGTDLIGSGELNSVPGGSSGFNNARQRTIPLTLSGQPAFPPGSTLSIKLLVRNACAGSGKNSGTARLWYDDGVANSRFDATIGDPATYYLRSGAVLSIIPGPGSKKTSDVAAGAKCSPFKPFGTWTTTIQ